MKTLYLVRHSKAVQRDPDLPDFERNLVKAGEISSLNMAKKLKKEGVAPDLLISSTATRALETAHLFAKAFQYPVEKLLVKDALYQEMSAEAMLYLIRQIDNSLSSIMLFGHNPAFSELAKYLVPGFTESIPKSGIVGIAFETTSWKGLDQGGGKLIMFDFPKREAKTHKRLKKDLETTLRRRIHETLDTIDTGAAAKQKKAIKKAAEKLTSEFMRTLKDTQGRERKDLSTPSPKKPRTKSSSA